MIIHITRPDPKKSSRINMQLRLRGGIAVHMQGKARFLAALASIYRNRQPSTYVFHQQASLPLFWLSLPALWWHGHTIVYDIHDLVMVNNRRGPVILLRNAILFVNEWLVFRLPRIRLMTVSKGLASVCQKRYGRRPDVVYNIHTTADQPSPSTNINEVPRVKGLRLVYFGLINPARIDLALIDEMLRATGGQLDLYGIFDAPGFEAQVAQAPGVHYRGEYRSSDLDFARNFDALWFVNVAHVDMNWQYCMPNKLFQALESGLALCIAGSCSEIVSEFHTDVLFESSAGTLLLVRPTPQNLNTLSQMQRQTISAFTAITAQCESQTQ